jgi:hypothetical protein
MRPQQKSYLKTCVIAACGAVVAYVGAFVTAAMLTWSLNAVCALVGMALTLVVIAGWTVLVREHRLDTGQDDVLLRLNASRSEAALAKRPPSASSALLGPRMLRRGLRVGDEVEVRPLEEIRQTLAPDGSLEALPFQSEMAQFCGRRFRVFRVVDKIYDYNRSRKLRRLEGVVSLAGVRCSGSAHGGCQAGCSLLWKESWLRRVHPGFAQVSVGASSIPVRQVLRAKCENSTTAAVSKPSDGPFRCQLTQLTAASRPICAWDIRQDLRPLFAGNLTIAAFCMALLTRLFNFIQQLHGGSGYPPVGYCRQSPKSPAGSFAPGCPVRVRHLDEIAATLDARSRNRGLWFDRDMVRYCGQRLIVRSRVEQIIDVLSGRLIELKSPTFTLEESTATGEFLRLCPQHEYNFWRDVWIVEETRANGDRAV